MVSDICLFKEKQKEGGGGGGQKERKETDVEESLHRVKTDT